MSIMCHKYSFIIRKFILGTLIDLIVAYFKQVCAFIYFCLND